MTFKNISRQIFLWSTILLIGFVLFLSIDLLYPMPEASNLKKFSQLVVDRNGQPLRAFADSQGVWRYPTQYNDVSNNYIEALINYEDRAFWRHRGVNPFALFRAAGQWLANGRAISGGSTISMQVARILDPHSKSIPGKLWQIFRAFQLEYHLDKKQILELYLNYAPFGGPIEGIEAAAFTYLGKSAKDLTHAEAALMAVLPQSPSRFRPDRYPLRAQKARDKVLHRLQKYSVWPTNVIEQAKQELVYAEFNSRPLIAPLLSRRLVKRYSEQQIIHSTIDLNIQLQVADLVKAYLDRFSETTSASAMLMDNKTLEVLAYVGAGSFADQKRYGHIDMNQAIRSPGSTLKPFIYGMAMDEQLIHSESLLQDVPLNYQQYSPKNFNKRFSGPVSVSHALQQSLNIPAVQVLSHLGPEKFAGHLENAGLKLYFANKSKPNLSLALGGTGVKLEDLVSVYRSLSAGGMAGKPIYVIGQPKREIFLMSEESAWVVGNILSKVSLNSFTRKGITQNQKQWIAHKTGTSYGYRDAWMIAVTDTHTLAVWVGKPDGTPSPGEFGRKTAAPLVKKIFNTISVNSRNSPARPAKVKAKSICWPLGTLKSSQLSEHCLLEKQAWVIDDVAPLTIQERALWQANPVSIKMDKNSSHRVFNACFAGDTISKSIAIWPSSLDPWLPSHWQYQNRLPPLHSDCQSKLDLNQRLIIIGLKNNSRISAPPDRQTALDISLIVTSGRGNVSWLKNGQLIGQSKIGEAFLISAINPGHHKIVVFDENGNNGELEFDVL